MSLRNFGPSRTLVLLDGHRVAPTNQDGSVNIDTLPQMLVNRVDIVTGGASAVYGSDAVAGVVNFMLDKNFTGLSSRRDGGISKYGDGEEEQFGAAWGTDLFGGRGHFETSRPATGTRTDSDQRAALRRKRAGLAARRQRIAGQPLREHALFARLQQRPVRQRPVRHRLRRQQLHFQSKRAS